MGLRREIILIARRSCWGWVKRWKKEPVKIMFRWEDRGVRCGEFWWKMSATKNLLRRVDWSRKREWPASSKPGLMSVPKTGWW